jgi:hypothetical protein
VLENKVRVYSNRKLSLSFSVDANSGFSVILRPNDIQLNPSHDQLSLQRYATHPTTRALMGQPQQQQVVSPSSVFFQHSPSASENDAQNGDNSEAANGAGGKYECPTNGHDTLSDFVTFVCQESEQTSSQTNQHRHSPKTQQYSQYNAMLPPPPLPPMAIPVTSGYSGELLTCC